MKPTKFLIDGIDRLGKSSLIKSIEDELGYHLVIHYDKPKIRAAHLLAAQMIKEAKPENTDFDITYRRLSPDNLAKRLFQEDVNSNMFKLLKSKVPIICDRTHLGEMVYAPLYRGYSGDYVFDMEKALIESKPFTINEDIRLILLTSSNTEMLVDDGLGFDPSKKDDEQTRFIEAYNRSNFTNKVIVDVHDGCGGYRTYGDIFEEAIYKRS